MSPKPKTAKPTTWQAITRPLSDRSEKGGPITDRKAILGVRKVRGKRYWLLRTESNYRGKEHLQQLVMLDETIDAVVDMYHKHRGTQAVEFDWRIANGTKLSKADRESVQKMSGLTRIEKVKKP